jgi:glutathione S-transferase
MDAGILCRYELVMRPKELHWGRMDFRAEIQMARRARSFEREAGSLAGEPTIGGITVGCALGWLDFRWADDNWRTKRPKLASWYEQFAARPSMQATMPSA